MFLWLKRFFGYQSSVFEYLRLYIQRSKFAKYPCEKVLGSNARVSDFGRFYDTHKDDLKYLKLLFETKFPDEDLFNFLKTCSDESLLIRKKEALKKEREALKPKKTLRKPAF